MFKRLWDRIGKNPLDALLFKAAEKEQKRFLIAWNRGLGDIALGLYPLVYRIRQIVSDAEITFMTRPDLEEGFSLLTGIDVLVAPEWKRGRPICLEESLRMQGIEKSRFDLLIERPDPTRWLPWAIGTLTPRLSWNSSWDELCQPFDLEEGPYIAVHLQTETKYGYEKNWPMDKWEKLFAKLVVDDRILLFGMRSEPPFSLQGVVDLRGKTTLLQMLSIIKNRCSLLIAPDSGVLSLIYYLDVQFPLRVISLWADPRQGILKQKVASPNLSLEHIALLGAGEQVGAITVDQVMEGIGCVSRS